MVLCCTAVAGTTAIGIAVAGTEPAATGNAAAGTGTATIEMAATGMGTTVTGTAAIRMGKAVTSNMCWLHGHSDLVRRCTSLNPSVCFPSSPGLQQQNTMLHPSQELHYANDITICLREHPRTCQRGRRPKAAWWQRILAAATEAGDVTATTEDKARHFVKGGKHQVGRRMLPQTR